MEVSVRQTVMTFNSDSGRGSSEPNYSRGNPHKKRLSPFEPKSISGPQRSQSMKQFMEPIKGLPLESPLRQNLFLPPTTNITPNFGEARTHPKEGRREIVADTPHSNSTSPTKKRISPTDSGIDLFSKESPTLSVSPTKINPKLRTMYNGSRRDLEDGGTEFSVNPDPVPYQPSNFMSATVVKKVPVSRRHLDSFGVGGVDLSSSLGKRGVMLHTDRYHWDLAQALDGLSQRERLQAELEYMERLRGIKRRREVLPHRAQLDLLMGGKKVEFCERFEIQREIQKLKSLILPQHAKDLFHGRGFTLPEHHNSIKPRRTLPTDIDFEEDIGLFPPDKYSFNPETGRVVPKLPKQLDASQHGMFPRINNKGYLLGHGSPIILSKERRTVEGIKARLRVPTKNFRAQKGEAIPIQTPNPFMLEMEDTGTTWTPYVTRQSTMMSPMMRASSKSPPIPLSPRRIKYKDKPVGSPDIMLSPTSYGLLSSPRYGTGLGGSSSSNAPHLRRSKTNVTSGGQLGQSGNTNARSLTAVPNKKDGSSRPTVGAPNLKMGPIPSPGREIKIPVSSRDVDDADPEPSPAVPITTPATAVGKKITGFDEAPNEMDVVLEEWPGYDQEDTQLTQGTRDSTRDAVASRQSAQSPTKATTPNPLKGVDLPSSISDEQQAQLKQTFNKLDTDKDGHLMFNQLQTQLPKQFSQAQEKYIKQVYEIVSSSTFFGLDEFMTMSYLTNVVTGLQGDALDAFPKLNFNNLQEVILKYVELYQAVDRTHKGKITLHSLQDILSTALSLDFKLDPQKWNKISDTLSLDFSGHVSKIEFLAHIPYFQTMKKQ